MGFTDNYVSLVMSVAESVKTKYPEAWNYAHYHGPDTYDYIILVIRELAEIDENKFGGNWQRGIIGDLAEDGLTVKADNGRYYFVDIIASAGTSNASITYNETGEAPAHGFAHVSALPTTFRNYDSHVCKLGCSLFWAPSVFRTNRDLLDANLDWIRNKLGADYVRILWKKGLRGNTEDPWYPHLTEDLITLQPDFIARVVDHIYDNFDLKIEMTIFGDNIGMTIDDEAELIDRFVRACRDRQNKIEHWEIFNEPYTYGGGHGGTSEMLRRNARFLKSGLNSDARISLGSPQSIHTGASRDDVFREVEKMYGGYSGANMMTPHFNRDINLPPELPEWAPRDRTNNEPIGPYSSNRHSENAQELAGHYLTTARASYNGYVFHADAGIWSNLINPIYQREDRGRWANLFDMPNMEAIAIALKIIRKDGVIIDNNGDTEMPLPDRGRVMNFLSWLHEYYKSDEGLQRPNGLWINDGPDFEGIGAWGYDVYLNAVIRGKSDDEAKQLVIQEIQKSEEWRSKHP